MSDGEKPVKEVFRQRRLASVSQAHEADDANNAHVK